MGILHPNTSCFFYKNVIKLMQNSYIEIHLTTFVFQKQYFPHFFSGFARQATQILLKMSTKEIYWIQIVENIQK
jgi:hypothetical protein